MGIIVFAYDFEHKKTQDFLLRLFIEGEPIDLVLAAPRVELDGHADRPRTKLRHRGLVHPRSIAARIGAEYLSVPHDSREAVSVLERRAPDLGVVAGARILPPEIIDCFRFGIINFHPGMIPEARGLDALLWSVRNDVPLGVTAHFIDENVDAGRILVKEPIDVFRDDTVLDLQERLYETQLEILKDTMDVARKDSGEGKLTERVDPTTDYNTRMSSELLQETLEMLPDYVRRYAESE